MEPADSNIASFSIAHDGESLSSANGRTEALFNVIHESPEFSVSKTALGPEYAAAMPDASVARGLALL